MPPISRTPPSGPSWDTRLRRHLRRGCDEGSGSVISYIVATSVFLLSSAFLLGYALDPHEGAIADLEHQEVRSKGTQALGVLLGSPGYPPDWESSPTKVDALERVGILERGASIRVDAAKFEALAKGRYATTSGSNGHVDYAEAKTALGLEGYDFHIKARPVATPAADATYGVGTGMTDHRVAYVGAFSGALPTTKAQSEAYVLDTLPVGFTNLTRLTAVGTGDVYPDDSATLRTALLPNIGTGAAQTILSQGSGTKYDFERVDPALYQSFFPLGGSTSRALALTDGAGQLGYSRNRELRAVVGEADLTGVGAATLTWNEWVDTDRGNFTYDTGDYGFVEVSTNGGATWTALTGPTVSAVTPHHASRDTSLDPHPASMVTRTIPLATQCPACAGNPSVLVAFHWVADNDNTLGYGWVVDDVRLTVGGATRLHKTFEDPEYDVLVVGSDVAHNAFTPNDVKMAIRDFVDLYGGRLVVLGGEQNRNWLDPLFRAGVRGGAVEVDTPDATHPILTVPNTIPWESFPTGGRTWDFTSDEADLFNAVLGSDDNHVLSVSAPGAFNRTSADGRVILTTLRPYEMSGASSFQFLANTLTYGRYRHVHLDFGPDIPTNIPIASATRTATMDRTVNASGDYVEMSFTFHVWPGGGSIPLAPPVAPVAGPPLNLTATPGNGDVMLSWSLPASYSTLGISGYVVRRGTSPSVIDEVVLQGTNPTQTSWTDAGRTNGVTYYYTLTSKNTAGEGPLSTTASATPRTTPAAPTDVSLLPLVGEVRVTWSPPASNGGTLVKGYRLTWNLSGDAVNMNHIELGSTTTFLHSGISDTVRCYAVRALNDVDYGAPSSMVCASPAVGPAVPSTFNATPGLGAGAITLTWGIPASLGSGTLTGYQLDAGADGVTYTPVATLASGNVSFVHAGLGASATRHYRLQAVTTDGPGAFAYANATTFAPPGPPTTFTASQGLTAGTVSLLWTAPTQLNGTTLTGYKVWAGQTSGALSLVATLTNATDVGWTHSGLTGSQTWFYTLQATTTGSDGANATERTATTLPPPGAPSTFNATRNLATPGAISLSWSAPLVWNGATGTGYKIYSGPNAGSLTLLATLASASNTTFVHHGLATNQTVTYKVAATSNVGEGTLSAAESATTQRAPNPPASLVGTAPVMGQTILTWTPPSETGGAGSITYKLYRGATAGTLTDLLYEGSSLTYTHSSYSVSKKHYTVVAVNTLGTSGGTGYQYS